MLKRAITGLILAPIVLLYVFYSSVPMFALGLSIVLLIAAYEWTFLVPIKSTLLRGVVLVIVSVLMIVAAGAGIVHLEILHPYYLEKLSQFWQVAPGLLWPYLFVMILFYPKSKSAWAYPFFVLGCMFVILPACLHLLILGKSNHAIPSGATHIIFLFLMIWGADTGAYFAGKLFGQHKLIPHVSPGKTIEGVLGGLLFIVLMGISFSYYSFYELRHAVSLGEVSWFTYFYQFDLSWIVGVFVASIMGDLLISMFKRRVNLKDTGSILPGHGGILDRIDSLLCASVVCTFWYCPSMTIY